MIHIADYDFILEDILIPFKLGEKVLFNLKFKGCTNHVDMFSTPELDAPGPPLDEIKASGHRLAFFQSLPVSRKMPRMAFRNGYICFALNHYKRYYIDTKGAFEEYLESHKGKTIATLNRKIRKATESSESSKLLRIFTTPDEISEFVGIAGEISRKTFQFKLLNQGLQESDQYLNDYQIRAGEKRIAGLILYAEDTPVAYNLCPIYGDGVMLYYYTGYDNDFRNYSPGTILQYLTIKEAFRFDHVKYYDFCAGEGKHKQMFASENKLCADMIYFPHTPKYFIVVLFKIFYDGLHKIIKFPLKRIGKADKIRMMIRSKAVQRQIF